MRADAVSADADAAAILSQAFALRAERRWCRRTLILVDGVPLLSSSGAASRI